MDIGQRTIAFNYPFSIVLCSFLDRRFVHQHNRDFVADRIYETALGILAGEFGLLVVDLDLGFTLRTAKDL